MDRINLGIHANTELGVGLYVSKPGSNVMDPESAISGNLMFDTNGPISSLNVIQTGNFKITCDRIALSSIGKFDSDGRPLGPDWNPNQQYLGYVAENSKAKLTNYMDTGMASIPIANPLPNGEIPEIALRFAVGNSSGHFHPWYANVSMNEHDSKNWDEFTYNDSSEIVHMDSPWVRMKWGGIGNEAYTGMHMTHKTTELLDSLETFSVGQGLTFTTVSVTYTNQGDGGGDVSYTNDTPSSLAGRFYVQTATPSSPGQNDIWIEDLDILQYKQYYSSSWSVSQSYTTAITDLITQREALIESMGIANPITNDDILAEIKKQEDSMKMFSTGMGNMQGLVGLIHYANSTHLTVNAFMTPTHSGLRDYSHNALDDYNNWHSPITDLSANHPETTDGGTPRKYMFPDASGTLVIYDGPWPGGRRAGWNFRSDKWWHRFGGNQFQITLAYDVQMKALVDLGLLGHPDDGITTYPTLSVNSSDPYFITPGAYEQSEFPLVAFPHLPMVETFQSYGNRLFHNTGNYTPFHHPLIPGAPFSDYYYRYNIPIREGFNVVPARGYDLLQRDHAKEDIYGWKGHPTQFFVNPFSNNMCTFTSHMAPGDTLGPAGSSMGSMGLGGAGSKTALKTDDCWDTFYCSYAVYSIGGSISSHSAQPPDTVVVDMRSTEFGGHLQQDTGKFVNDPIDAPYNMRRYYNLSFPEDFVGTIGDSATDPFSEVRDYTDAQNRIYGNVNVIFKIPFLNENVVGGTNYVHVGSKNMSYATVSVGGELVEGPVGVPDPAITFDLSDEYFIFENNKGMTLTIENSGYVMGGGGSGGRGERLGNLKQAGQSYMGGGGGAGSGSGGFEDEAQGSAYGGSVMSHNGPGIGGTGFGQGSAFDDSSDLIASEAQRGINGTSIVSELYMDRSNPTAAIYSLAPAGGSAATVFSQVQGLYTLAEPVEGGNGGDAFKVLTGTYLPTIEIINKPNIFLRSATTQGGVLSFTFPGGVIVSGGGGGGGGVGKIPRKTNVLNDPAHATGASGAKPGYNANETQGTPDEVFNFFPGVTQKQGGLAGYIVSGNDGGAYNGRVSIRNEAGPSGSTIRGRHPTSTTRDYVAGFEVPPDETKVYN